MGADLGLTALAGFRKEAAQWVDLTVQAVQKHRNPTLEPRDPTALGAVRTEVEGITVRCVTGHGVHNEPMIGGTAAGLDAGEQTRGEV